MTRDEILKMSDGRKTDVLIAREVFSIIVSTIAQSGTPLLYLDLVSGEEVPRYTEDIAAAWQVVEKILRAPCDDYWTGPTMQINAEMTKSKGEYQVVFEHLDSIDLFPSSVEATAETMPLAIGRAALLAVMEIE